jgi:DNA-directed RNA polymerase II subunit RPB9
LLYPKADPQRRIMVYACRICPYDEIAENKCVYRNDLLTVTKCVLRSFVLMQLSVCFFVFREQKGVTTDLGTDPTLVCLTHIQDRGLR